MNAEHLATLSLGCFGQGTLDGTAKSKGSGTGRMQEQLGSRGVIGDVILITFDLIKGYHFKGLHAGVFYFLYYLSC